LGDNETRNVALKRLTFMKRRLRCKNIVEVVERLWAFWEKEHGQTEKTAALNLLESTACRFRFEHKGVYKCAKYAPRTVKRLETLKICEICKAKDRAKLKSISMPQRAWVKKVTNDFEERQKLEANQILNGTKKHWCSIDRKALSLMDLPCVKGVKNPKDSSQKIGCRHFDCETRVKRLVRQIYGVAF